MLTALCPRFTLTGNLRVAFRGLQRPITSTLGYSLTPLKVGGLMGMKVTQLSYFRTHFLRFKERLITEQDISDYSWSICTSTPFLLQPLHTHRVHTRCFAGVLLRRKKSAWVIGMKIMCLNKFLNEEELCGGNAGYMTVRVKSLYETWRIIAQLNMRFGLKCEKIVILSFQDAEPTGCRVWPESRHP